MNYPIVLHKDTDSDYGVTVPDLPGCFSAGRSVDEAMAMAREAIELHIEGLIVDGRAVPRPGSIEAHRRKTLYKGGVWALVSIDESSLRVGAKRINVTMPERVLDAVDRHARREGETRSGLLVRAVTQLMGRDQDEALQTRRKRGRPSQSKSAKKKSRAT